MGRAIVNKQIDTGGGDRIAQSSTLTSIPTNTSTPIDSSTSKEVINLSRRVYSKGQYEKVIDTKFSQLATTISPSEQAAQTTSTTLVDQFFQDYQQLFLQIPKEGATNSHEYLIKTSSEYINFTPTDDSIQALIEEINILQQNNLELNQQLVTLSISSSQA